jgi:hypothetical protein
LLRIGKLGWRHARNVAWGGGKREAAGERLTLCCAKAKDRYQTHAESMDFLESLGRFELEALSRRERSGVPAKRGFRGAGCKREPAAEILSAREGSHTLKSRQSLLLEALGRFELPTCGLGNRRSIHLSYRALMPL